jgi:hypothetical protein
VNRRSSGAVIAASAGLFRRTNTARGQVPHRRAAVTKRPDCTTMRESSAHARIARGTWARAANIVALPRAGRSAPAERGSARCGDAGSAATRCRVMASVLGARERSGEVSGVLQPTLERSRIGARPTGATGTPSLAASSLGAWARRASARTAVRPAIARSRSPSCPSPPPTPDRIRRPRRARYPHGENDTIIVGLATWYRCRPLLIATQGGDRWSR